MGVTGHFQDASEADTVRCIGGQDCRRSWGPEDEQIVGMRGGHVSPVDEVVDHRRPLCEERTVVNAAKAKKGNRDDREDAYRFPGENSVFRAAADYRIPWSRYCCRGDLVGLEKTSTGLSSEIL